MNNPSTAPRPDHAARQPASPARRRARPPRGIDVPTTLWLPPTGPTPTRESPGRLPDWARARLADEHTTPTRSALAGTFRDEDPSPRLLRPLTASHTDTTPAPTAIEAGRAGLVLLEVADTDDGPNNQTRTCDRWLRSALDQALRALAPGAVVAIAFGDDVTGPHITRPGAAIAAARARGFTYQQHLIVITAALHGDRLRPLATDRHREHRRALRASGLPVSTRAHRDLFLFTAPTPGDHPCLNPPARPRPPTRATRWSTPEWAPPCG
jgi:hypothetical protein